MERLGLRASTRKSTDIEWTWMIDTGDGTCDLTLPTSKFMTLVNAAHLPEAITSSFCIKGVVKTVAARMPAANIAGSTYHGMLVESVASSIGTVGSGFLSRHLFTLDLPNHQLYLRPGRAFDHREDISMSGLHFDGDSREGVAEIVDFGSPAYEAGIRNGDVVLTLDGRSFGEYDTDELWNVLHAGRGPPNQGNLPPRRKDQLGDVQSSPPNLNSAAVVIARLHGMQRNALPC